MLQQFDSFESRRHSELDLSECLGSEMGLEFVSYNTKSENIGRIKKTQSAKYVN